MYPSKGLIVHFQPTLIMSEMCLPCPILVSERVILFSLSQVRYAMSQLIICTFAHGIPIQTEESK